MRILYTLFIAVMITCCSCNDNQEQQEILSEAAACMVRFEKSDSGNEYFNVAVRDEYKKYIWYVFRLRHYKDHSAMEYKDLWRIDWAYEARYDEQTGEMENILDKIMTDGESESVLKDYGENYGTSGHVDTDDFTGGFHGDERIDLEEGCGVVFYIDGEALTDADLSESFGWRGCDVFSYVQKSTLHKTALNVGGQAVESDHHVVADHLKTTTFGDSGYVTENTIVMRDEIDFYWYFGICCVGTAVAEMGYNEDMEVVTFDRSGGNRLSGVGKCEYTAWSGDNAIEVHVKANIVSGADDSSGRMFIWDTQNYAKYYRRWPGTGAHTASVGESFSSKMTVTFATR